MKNREEIKKQNKQKTIQEAEHTCAKLKKNNNTFVSIKTF